jgi:Xaa-Pro aminopeptidase
MDYVGRRSRLAQRLTEHGLDGLLITKMTNIRYLTGFTGTTAYLLFSESPVLTVDFRYREQAGRESGDVEVRFSTSSQELWPDTVKVLRESRLERVGVESANMVVARYLELLDLPGIRIVPVRDTVERLRWNKDAEEIAAIREAARIADEVAEEMIDVIKPGMTEHRVAGEIELRQRSRGGERSASEIIVASGPRSSMPHGIASDRVIGEGEPVMLDLGTVVQGYLSDLTRTYHVGRPSAELERIHRIVHEAQELAEAQIRPGMTGRQADAIARDHIVSSGFGDRFGHSLGHSIGLDNHEFPLLSPFDSTVIEVGMVTTVEPGIYVPGVGGVRIEDMVIFTETGCEVVSASRRDLAQVSA